MANSKRQCKHCKEYFLVEAMVKLGSYTFCSMSHGVEFAAKKGKAANDRKLKRIKREKDTFLRAEKRRVNRNPRKEALEAAQLLARISAADDSGYVKCVTCSAVGKYNDGFDGGHFIAKGSSSYWMLDPRNIHPQCKPCNGNGMKYDNTESVYTMLMIDQYGRKFVEKMHDLKRTKTKRCAKDYDEFIAKAKAEIAKHKARIS